MAGPRVLRSRPSGRDRCARNVTGSIARHRDSETDHPARQGWGLFPRAIKEGSQDAARRIRIWGWDYYAKHRKDAQQFRRRRCRESRAWPRSRSRHRTTSPQRPDSVEWVVHRRIWGHPRSTQAVGVLFRSAARGRRSISKEGKASRAGGLAGRVEVVGGDFFKRFPPWERLMIKTFPRRDEPK